MNIKHYTQVLEAYEDQIRKTGAWRSYTITNKEFVRVWQTSNNREEVEKRLKDLYTRFIETPCLRRDGTADHTFFADGTVRFHIKGYIDSNHTRLVNKGVKLKSLHWETIIKPETPCPWEQLNEYAQSFPR